MNKKIIMLVMMIFLVSTTVSAEECGFFCQFWEDFSGQNIAGQATGVNYYDLGSEDKKAVSEEVNKRAQKIRTKEEALEELKYWENRFKQSPGKKAQLQFYLQFLANKGFITPKEYSQHVLTNKKYDYESVKILLQSRVDKDKQKAQEAAAEKDQFNQADKFYTEALTGSKPDIKKLQNALDMLGDLNDPKSNALRINILESMAYEYKDNPSKLKETLDKLDKADKNKANEVREVIEESKRIAAQKAAQKSSQPKPEPKLSLIQKLDKAVKDLKGKKGKYSDHKELIDKLYKDGLLTDEEYDEINGGFLGFGQENIAYVQNIINKKKAVEDAKAQERIKQQREQALRDAERNDPNSLTNLCDQGQIDKCEAAGSKASSEGNLDDAAKFFKKSCDRNSAVGCSGLGSTLLRQGAELTRDKDGKIIDSKVKDANKLAEAEKAYAKACNAGDASSCRNAGRLHEAYLPLEKRNQIKMYDYFRKGCDKDDADSCVGAGSGYARGGDNEKAVSAYEKACDGGNKIGCYNAGRIREKGTDQTLTLRAFRKGCELGDKQSCDKKAAMEKGPTAPVEDKPAEDWSGDKEFENLPGELSIKGNQLVLDCGFFCIDKPLRINEKGDVEGYTSDGWKKIDLRKVPNVKAKAALLAQQQAKLAELAKPAPPPTEQKKKAAAPTPKVTAPKPEDVSNPEIEKVKAELAEANKKLEKAATTVDEAVARKEAELKKLELEKKLAELRNSERQRKHNVKIDALGKSAGESTKKIIATAGRAPRGLIDSKNLGRKQIDDIPINLDEAIASLEKTGEYRKGRLHLVRDKDGKVYAANNGKLVREFGTRGMGTSSSDGEFRSRSIAPDTKTHDGKTSALVIPASPPLEKVPEVKEDPAVVTQYGTKPGNVADLGDKGTYVARKVGDKLYWFSTDGKSVKPEAITELKRGVLTYGPKRTFNSIDKIGFAKHDAGTKVFVEGSEYNCNKFPKICQTVRSLKGTYAQQKAALEAAYAEDVKNLAEGKTLPVKKEEAKVETPPPPKEPKPETEVAKEEKQPDPTRDKPISLDDEDFYKDGKKVKVKTTLFEDREVIIDEDGDLAIKNRLFGSTKLTSQQRTELSKKGLTKQLEEISKKHKEFVGKRVILESGVGSGKESVNVVGVNPDDGKLIYQYGEKEYSATPEQVSKQPENWQNRKDGAFVGKDGHVYVVVTTGSKGAAQNFAVATISNLAGKGVTGVTGAEAVDGQNGKYLVRFDETGKKGVKAGVEGGEKSFQKIREELGKGVVVSKPKKEGDTSRTLRGLSVSVEKEITLNGEKLTVQVPRTDETIADMDDGYRKFRKNSAGQWEEVVGTEGNPLKVGDREFYIDFGQIKEKVTGWVDSTVVETSPGKYAIQGTFGKIPLTDQELKQLSALEEDGTVVTTNGKPGKTTLGKIKSTVASTEEQAKVDSKAAAPQPKTEDTPHPAPKKTFEVNDDALGLPKGKYEFIEDGSKIKGPDGSIYYRNEDGTWEKEGAFYDPDQSEAVNSLFDNKYFPPPPGTEKPAEGEAAKPEYKKEVAKHIPPKAPTEPTYTWYHQEGKTSQGFWVKDGDTPPTGYKKVVYEGEIGVTKKFIDKNYPKTKDNVYTGTVPAPKPVPPPAPTPPQPATKETPPQGTFEDKWTEGTEVQIGGNKYKRTHRKGVYRAILESGEEGLTFNKEGYKVSADGRSYMGGNNLPVKTKAEASKSSNYEHFQRRLARTPKIDIKLTDAPPTTTPPSPVEPTGPSEIFLSSKNLDKLENSLKAAAKGRDVNQETSVTESEIDRSDAKRIERAQKFLEKLKDEGKGETPEAIALGKAISNAKIEQAKAYQQASPRATSPTDTKGVAPVEEGQEGKPEKKLPEDEDKPTAPSPQPAEDQDEPTPEDKAEPLADTSADKPAPEVKPTPKPTVEFEKLFQEAKKLGESRKWSDAESKFRVALKTAKTEKDKARAQVGIGVALQSQGKHAEALRAYEVAAKSGKLSEKNNDKNNLNRANALIQLGDYARAKPLLDSLLKKNKGNKDAQDLLKSVNANYLKGFKKGDKVKVGDKTVTIKSFKNGKINGNIKPKDAKKVAEVGTGVKENPDKSVTFTKGGKSLTLPKSVADNLPESLKKKDAFKFQIHGNELKFTTGGTQFSLTKDGDTTIHRRGSTITGYTIGEEKVEKQGDNYHYNGEIYSKFNKDGDKITLGSGDQTATITKGKTVIRDGDVRITKTPEFKLTEDLDDKTATKEFKDKTVATKKGKLWTYKNKRGQIIGHTEGDDAEKIPKIQFDFSSKQCQEGGAEKAQCYLVNGERQTKLNTIPKATKASFEEQDLLYGRTKDSVFTNIAQAAHGPVSLYPLANKFDWYRDYVRKVDQAFAKFYPGIDYFESAICENWAPIETGDNMGVIKTGPDTYQFVGHIEAERIEVDFLTCDEKCPDGLVCKEDNFCYHPNSETPESGYLYKISWGVVAPRDEKFLPIKGAKGESISFNVKVYPQGEEPYFLYEDKFGNNNVNTIKLGPGENSESKLPPIFTDYSTKVISKVCIEFGENRPLSLTEGTGIGDLADDDATFNPGIIEDVKKPIFTKPVPDLCDEEINDEERQSVPSSPQANIGTTGEITNCGLQGC